MWTHCIVCAADLGKNEDVEAFPVGDCLVFDAFRGRLWAVCRRCHRWNLTPLEERWDALEELGRLWSEAPAKVRGEELALARLRSGLRIIRVGRDPSEKEVAFWRWGRGYGVNWRSVAGWSAGAVAGAAGVATAFSVLPPITAFLGVGYAAVVGGNLALLSQRRRVPTEQAGSVASLKRHELLKAGMAPRDDWLGWSIHVERLFSGSEAGRRSLRRVSEAISPFGPPPHWVEFTGSRAVAIARKAFPLINRPTSKGAAVSDALELIQSRGGVSGYLPWAASAKPRWVPFRQYPEVLRLSLEIALFQDEERKALDGEIGALEFAWREAEAIALISDGLLPPKGWEEFRSIHLADEG